MTRRVTGTTLFLVAFLGFASARADRPDPSDGLLRGKGHCVKQCTKDRRQCIAPVREALRTCLEPCASLREAAEAACPAGSENGAESAPEELSPECQAALEALRACVIPCRDPFRTAARQCLRQMRGCLRDTCAVRVGDEKLRTPKPTRSTDP